MYVAGLPIPACSFADQSSSPLSALSALIFPSLDSANTTPPAVVTVPPPFICFRRQRSVCVTGSHATSDPPGGIGSAAACPGAGGGGGRNTMPQLYEPTSGLKVDALTYRKVLSS